MKYKQGLCGSGGGYTKALDGGSWSDALAASVGPVFKGINSVFCYCFISG